MTRFMQGTGMGGFRQDSHSFWIAHDKRSSGIGAACDRRRRTNKI